MSSGVYQNQDKKKTNTKENKKLSIVWPPVRSEATSALASESVIKATRRRGVTHDSYL